jgi:hypothetical protein
MAVLIIERCRLNGLRDRRLYGLSALRAAIGNLRGATYSPA